MKNLSTKISAVSLFLVTLTSSVHAYTLDNVEVSGIDKAEVLFAIKNAEESVPQIKVDGNVVEISFLGGEVGKDLSRRDWNSVHPLIQSINVGNDTKGTARVRLVVAGSSESLKKRVRLEKTEKSVRLFVDFPLSATSAATESIANWREAEQLPLGRLEASNEKVRSRSQTMFVMVGIFLVLISAGVAVWFFKNAKNRGAKRGSRKYLIEQMAFHPMGNRSGVSLLKVGNEFVLVGITPQSITMLSAVPELKERYAEESKFERDDFKVAVEEELGRLKSSQMPRVSA